MSTAISEPGLLDQGTLPFTIESRTLRELGERLVKQPEVAVVELVKNAYDADATMCTVDYDVPHSIRVQDNGLGMTLDRFTQGWMRIGTSSKEALAHSERYLRLITGDKGIGRFAVRFLGRELHLESVAYDPKRRLRTRLIADFDWLTFDRNEDLGRVRVPYRLVRADQGEHTGTTLTIKSIRPGVESLDLKKVRTGSIGILTPLRSLFRKFPASGGQGGQTPGNGKTDPGFILQIRPLYDDDQTGGDVAAKILDGFVLRASLRLTGDKLDLKVFRRGAKKPQLEVIDKYPNNLGRLYADIRFFPRRKGSFVDMGVDGRLAYTWVVENSGVAVFDRTFRVHPYGMTGDDWLQLSADAARNTRDPRSSIAIKHFPMPPNVRASTSENWMLRLPQPAQLVGLVQVEGRRTKDKSEEGLIASADREGFVENEAYRQLNDLVRGAAEMIAVADRELQQEQARKAQEALITSIRAETKSAIKDIQANPHIAAPDKARIVAALALTQQLAEQQEETAREREQQLEIMSLLGVVAGFMTHEFGVALHELQTTLKDLKALARTQPKFNKTVHSFDQHIRALRDFVSYSQGYIRGARLNPTKPYPVRPRLQQVKRIFGKYAEDRNISVEVSAESDLMAPNVPVSLYNGIALNLFTNALKAVTAKAGNNARVIAFRAWNDAQWHYLEVSDTGVGIPATLRRRVFDPLFTTTYSRQDPLGSGMGLGLTLVRRGSEAYGGRAELVKPPPNFATCVRVRLPLEIESGV